MKIVKKIFLILFCCSIFTACRQNKTPDYNLNLISPSFSKIYRQYITTETETNRFVLRSANEYTKAVNGETAKHIKSVSVCDDNVSDETAVKIIDTCKEYNIPVFFLMKDIPAEILQSYDKAYCLSADYVYIGEIFAEKINEMWTNEIIDKNSDQIFTFTVIKPENLSAVQQAFYDSLMKNIELLGIPLEQLDDIYLSQDEVVSYCTDNKKANEGYIILDSNYLQLFPENYTPAGDGIEIIGIEFSLENSYINYPYMKLCFIDYSAYFNARDAIMANIESKNYPFEGLEYSIIDKNVFIEPTI